MGAVFLVLNEDQAADVSQGHQQCVFCTAQNQDGTSHSQTRSMKNQSR